MEHVAVATEPNGRLRIFGPFDDEEAANDWAEENIPLQCIDGMAELEDPDVARWDAPR